MNSTLWNSDQINWSLYLFRNQWTDAFINNNYIKIVCGSGKYQELTSIFF